MSARSRLNEAYLFGAVIWATFLGLVFSSWTVFGISAGVFIALNVIGGNIRLGGAAFTPRRQFRPRRFAASRR
jgi:hypothetical protein